MRVFLVRHGEADPGQDVPDRARKLTTAGRRDARRLGEWLSSRELPPDVLACSSAVRAAQTADQILRALGVPGRDGGSDELYLATAAELMSILRDLVAAGSTPLLIGHNPGIAELAMKLAQFGEASALRRLTSRFPPAACAELELRASASSGVATSGGELVAYWTPALA